MKKLALFLLLFAGGLIVYSQFSKATPYTFTFREILLEGRNLMDRSLKNAVENILQDSEGRYGVYIKNLKTGETYERFEHEIFAPASLYKLWVMGTVFEKIKEGKISEDEKLVADVKALNNKYGFSEEDAELQEAIINFTIKSALGQMITISHNYAALALIERVKRSEVETFLKKYDLGASTMGTTDDLKTTPADVGKLLEKIYKGEIIDREYSQKMIELLLRQQKNDRIPKLLPEGTKIAHKTGEMDNVRNDGGIVYSPNGDFIIVVLAETKSPIAADENIAQISKVVFEYFNKAD